MRHLTLIVLTMALLCGACTGERVYDHYNHTPIAGWDKVDTLIFNVPPMLSDGRYDTNLGLRINKSYPFMSLTLIVEQTIYPGRKTYTDTLVCKLIGDDGSIKGQGISSYQYRYHVSELMLHAKDSLHITVRHNMMREILPGISDIGISLEKR